jgi:NADH:flavin oxidoreductase / NADH oxidase family
MMPERGAFRALASTLATSEHVYQRLKEYNLSHVLLMRQQADLTGTPLQALQGDGVLCHFRKRYSGNLILNVGINSAHAEQLLQEGLGDLVAFGREYIANPDLVERIRRGSPLNAQRPSRLLRRLCGGLYGLSHASGFGSRNGQGADVCLICNSLGARTIEFFRERQLIGGAADRFRSSGNPS